MKQSNNMVDNEFDLIAENESSHWWYKSLHLLVLNVLKDNKVDLKAKIVDAGCGTGGLIQLLVINGYKNIYGFDISEKAIRYCLDKKLNVEIGDLRKLESNLSNNEIDVFICNDAFYFLTKQEQIEMLNIVYNRLSWNGIAIFNCPALKHFSGLHDLQVGIENRTSIGKFKDLLNENKFRITQITYWPFLLSPIIWITRFIQRIKASPKHFNAKSDLKEEPYLINKFCYLITLIENKLFSRKPFGSSLFLVLKKVKHG